MTDTPGKRPIEPSLWRRMIAQHRMPLALIAGDGIIFVNHAFVAVTGYAADEMIGSNLSILAGADSDPEACDTLGSAVATMTEALVEVQHYRRNGSSFWDAVQLTPVQDDRGGHYMMAILLDVTRRWRAETGQPGAA